jgi:riboflavin biosynthesis pyrimidine reductase
MSDDAAGARFTVLDPKGDPGGPIESLDDGRMTDFYSYPDDLQACWVRGNMIASLDGGATDDGKAGGLAGAGDRAMFGLMRQQADVILVGAGTVRIENYSGAQFSPAQRQARQRRGQAEVPPIAVVTNSGEFDHDAKLFTRTEVPPLILTSADAVGEIRGRLGSVAEVIDASGRHTDRVDGATVLKILGDRKLYRVLTEGGPSFLSLLIQDGLLDELCLTIAPLLVGGAARRIATGSAEVHIPMRRSHLLTDDAGYLYTRYERGH